MGPAFDPRDGIAGWLVGTPPVLSLVGVEEGAALVAEAGIGAIRAKSVALTEYAVTLLDTVLAPLGFTLGSPRDPARRGGHVSIRHPDARALTVRLIERKVIPDFRNRTSSGSACRRFDVFVDVRRSVDTLATCCRLNSGHRETASQQVSPIGRCSEMLTHHAS
jgi:kynureninase